MAQGFCVYIAKAPNSIHKNKQIFGRILTHVSYIINKSAKAASTRKLGQYRHEKNVDKTQCCERWARGYNRLTSRIYTSLNWRVWVCVCVRAEAKRIDHDEARVLIVPYIYIYMYVCLFTVYADIKIHSRTVGSMSNMLCKSTLCTVSGKGLHFEIEQ